jgi:hypothetical protein
LQASDRLIYAWNAEYQNEICLTGVKGIYILLNSR